MPDHEYESWATDDQCVDVAPGRTKQLRHCTAEELEAVLDGLVLRGVRSQAAVANLHAGMPAKCDWQDPSGSYCENDASWYRRSMPERPWLNFPIGLCADHYHPAAGDYYQPEEPAQR